MYMVAYRGGRPFEQRSCDRGSRVLEEDTTTEGIPWLSARLVDSRLTLGCIAINMQKKFPANR